MGCGLPYLSIGDNDFRSYTSSCLSFFSNSTLPSVGTDLVSGTFGWIILEDTHIFSHFHPHKTQIYLESPLEVVTDLMKNKVVT